MPNGDPVLAARFAVPALPKSFVCRPRLVEKLSEGARDCPLVLVNGPAGAGKTLLVADWVSSAPTPVQAVWLTLDREDNAPGVFWTNVLAAFRHHGMTLPHDIGSPSGSDEVDPSLLARLAFRLSGEDVPRLLVLDEFERVSSAEVASELHAMLRHAAPGLRLVLISRTEPLLPIHRYRAAGEITEIRRADLAFTPEETAELLRRHGLSLPDGSARALTERTAGWAAGIRLSALAAQGAATPETFLEELEADRSAIADFLLAEVLDAQPVETQDLLLRTSILDRTNPDLANALTGRQDAERILSQLHRVNAFVEPVGHSWYRQHPLFTEILRMHLRARHPGLEPELHRRAARWLSGAGQLSEALPQAAAAGDWAFAAAQFVGSLAIGQLFTGLDANRLADLFSGMQPQTSGAAPEVIRAARDLARYDVGSGLEHLRRAEKYLRDGNPAHLPAVQLSCAFLRVRAGRLLGSADMAQAAAEAAAKLEHVVPAELLEQHPELPALLRADLGSALLWEGRFDAAKAAFSAAVGVSDSTSTICPRYESLCRLALIDLLRGWLGRAETQARQAASEAERFGRPLASRTGVGQLVLAAVAIDRDRLSTAQTALDLAGESPASRQDPVVAMGLTIVRARLLTAGGDPPGALASLAETNESAPAGTRSPWVSDHLALAASAAHLADGDPEAALHTLEAHGQGSPECATVAASAHLASGRTRTALEILNSIPRDRGSGPAVTVRTLLVRAQTATALGDEAAARRLVARALSSARPELLRRPFRDAGPWLSRLLHSRAALVQGHDWLAPGLDADLPRPEPGGGPAAPVEPLSHREHEVLERAAQLMSTDEIAADLYLSVNTVKSHLKSINRKLSATRRGEAVRRARELHLL
ncbi:LuxR family transcriptional regulator [Kitasatospora sp. CMC57]|uniref:LuxR family transcriptional regulator n=2 Tax=Kitasatospora sp. CMC57 TaxID=3231513 RepID=A0AB33K770_9ACTN